MEIFTSLTGIVAPLDRSNVDTDAIIPKQFLKSVQRTGFGPYLFDEWRYQDYGEPGMDCSRRPLKTDFVLNRAPFDQAQVLLTRANFGCGSSREHAPWAIADFGIRVIIAESYADIFYNNCFKNGILPVTLDTAQVDALFDAVSATPGYRLKVDLSANIITTPEGISIPFQLEEYRRDSLLKGLDEIGLTLQHAAEITAFEERYKKIVPWNFK